jgi:hypothetical protein
LSTTTSITKTTITTPETDTSSSTTTTSKLFTTTSIETIPKDDLITEEAPSTVTSFLNRKAYLVQEYIKNFKLKNKSN